MTIIKHPGYLLSAFAEIPCSGEDLNTGEKHTFPFTGIAFDTIGIAEDGINVHFSAENFRENHQWKMLRESTLNIETEKCTQQQLQLLIFATQELAIQDRLVNPETDVHRITALDTPEIPVPTTAKREVRRG